MKGKTVAHFLNKTAEYAVTDRQRNAILTVVRLLHDKDATREELSAAADEALASAVRYGGGYAAYAAACGAATTTTPAAAANAAAACACHAASFLAIGDIDASTETAAEAAGYAARAAGGSYYDGRRRFLETI